MEETKELCDTGGAEPPRLLYVKEGDDLQMGDHAFLRPLPVCCAAIASPFWGRVIGSVSNTGTREVLVNILATLFDENGRALATYKDFMVLDGGEKSEYDIKITGFDDSVRTYGLEAIEVQQL